MALSKLDETSRLKYAIKDSLTAGVVVTGVEFEFAGRRARTSSPAK